MKAIHIFSISALLILIGCSRAEQIPRGIDKAGVWEVDYFTDSFGDPTDQPFLRGTFCEGEYSGVESSFWWGIKEKSGEGKLVIRYRLKRTGEMIKKGKKEVPEEIPVVDIALSYKSEPSDTSYYYSNLWDAYNDWDVKIETDGLDPFTGQECFDSDDYRRLTFRGEEAEKIMAIFENGAEMSVRARCKKSNDHDEYSFSINEETLKDLSEVLKGYHYHYSEYLRKEDEKTKESGAKKK